MNNALFSPKVLVFGVSSILLLGLLSFFLQVSGTSNDAAINRRYFVWPNSYSKSAIGHLGSFEALKELGWNVVRYRGKRKNTYSKRRELLIFAEPIELLQKDGDIFRLWSSPDILLILPKRFGFQDRKKREWIEHTRLVSLNNVEDILQKVVLDGKVIRSDTQHEWEENKIGFAPTLVFPVQTFKSAKVYPIVATQDGNILLGSLNLSGKRQIWILSDPDLFANHGFSKGKNMAFVNEIMHLIHDQKDHTSIVFDEAIHGFRDSTFSVLRLLIQFPFSIFSGLLGVFIFLLLWGSMARFGVPQIPPRHIDFGKRMLITNSAELINLSEKRFLLFERYFQSSIQTVFQELHGPPNMGETEILKWLTKTEQTRKVSLSVIELMDRFHLPDRSSKQFDQNMLKLIQDIYIWKKEILDGTPRR